MKTNKQIGLLAALLINGSIALAQTPDRYQTVMLQLLARQDTAESVQGNLEVANAFARVATTEKNQWLPYYYSAHGTVLAALDEEDVTKVDPLCDQATKYLNEAEQLSPNNSEIYCIRALITLAGIKVNMMARGLDGLSTSQSYLEKAMELDPKNPRAYFLLGQQAFNTPERIGGSKKEALAYFEKAIALADAQSNRNGTIDINWGRRSAERMANRCRELLAAKN